MSEQQKGQTNIFGGVDTLNTGKKEKKKAKPAPA